MRQAQTASDAPIFCPITARSDVPIWRCDVGAVYGSDRLSTAVSHHQLQLALKNFQNPVDACLPESPQSPQERASDPHGPGPQRDRLKHVRSPPDTSVDKHGNPIADLV